MPERERYYYAVDDGNYLLAEKSAGRYYMLSSGGRWVHDEDVHHRIMSGDVDRITRAEADKIAGHARRQPRPYRGVSEA